MGHWEWIIIEVVILALVLAELVSIRRTIRRDKQNKPPDANG